MPYRDKTTGQDVQLAGPVIDGTYIQVTSGFGVRLMRLSNLEEYDPVTKVRTALGGEGDPLHEEAPPPPAPVETRLNLNIATAEHICQFVKGIGYSTAKRIVELRQSLPEERFRSLDQLRSIGRVNWDTIIADDRFFLG